MTRVHVGKELSHLILMFSNGEFENCGIKLKRILRTIIKNNSAFLTNIKNRCADRKIVNGISFGKDGEILQIDNDNCCGEFFSENYDRFMIFLKLIDSWMINLERLKQFIDENGRRPSRGTETEKIIGYWLFNQIKNYKMSKHGMRDKNRRKIWNDFINDEKYKNYFTSQDDNWMTSLECLKQFIDENERRPSQKIETEKILGYWLSNQIKNYKNGKKGMQDENRRQLWEEFINDEKYEEYFSLK